MLLATAIGFALANRLKVINKNGFDFKLLILTGF